MSFAARAALLVSLSMPDNTLKAYVRQSERYAIPIVIRGLYKNPKNPLARNHIGSFKDTVMRIEKIVGNEKTGGVSIDPLLFQAFAIHAVPALVIYNEHDACLQKTNARANAACSAQRFDVVYGNAPIQTLLSVVKNQTTSLKRRNFVEALLRSGERA